MSDLPTATYEIQTQDAAIGRQVVFTLTTFAGIHVVEEL